MAEKQIRVLSPVTSNGLLNVIGANGQMVFRESILAATARPMLEKINEKLPDNLKHRISDVVTDKPGKKETT
jgi:hypothetical protein